MRIHARHQYESLRPEKVQATKSDHQLRVEEGKG